jgi:hypothetical protein
MYFPNKKLGKEVAALIERPTTSWALIGLLLDQVERNKYWARDAQSFSEWLKSFAARIGMKESSLWRYLSASRYYQKLRKDLNLRKIRSPSLAGLPESVSAENLELLEKLERVVPKKEFEGVAERVLAGDLKRNELREHWKTYRPILLGRTARGKGVIAPRIDPTDREQLMFQGEARALSALMRAGSQWTEIRDPESYYAMREVILPKAEGLETRVIKDPKKGLLRRAVFDMLAVVRKSVESPVMLIGVVIFSRIQTLSDLKSVAPYCDRLWVALAGEEKKSETPSNVAQLPEFVGILRVKPGGVQVERPASEACPALGVKTGEMAKELLLHLLRG